MRVERVFSTVLCAAVAVLGLAGAASQPGRSGEAVSSSMAQPVASFGDADRDRTITVHRGQPLHLTLDTTNWQLDPQAGDGVIRWQPQAVVSGSGDCAVINPVRVGVDRRGSQADRPGGGARDS